MPANADDPAESESPDSAALDRGARLRKEGRCAEALPVLEKLLERQLQLRPPYPSDEDAVVRRLYRDRQLRAEGRLTADNDFRHAAQWEIGLCKFALRDYQGALVAFQRSRAYPLGSWCGNADREWEYRHDLYEGLTLEHLGRAAEAIAPYRHAAAHTSDGGPAAANRLFDLYAASGQLQDLRNIAAQADHGRPIKVVAYRFRILDLEQAHAWPELVQELGNRQGNTTLVAEALSRHGDETVPLLFAEVDKVAPHTWWTPHVWRTLGRSVTPKTLTAIVERARIEPQPFVVVHLVEGLRLAGPTGEQALALLDKGATGRLRKVLDMKPDSSARRSEAVTFPPLPSKVRLPASIAPETARAR